MSRKISFLFLFAMLLFFYSIKAQEARLLRFPSTNGREIVFTYAGDLYKVSVDGGQAQRLTSYIGYEMFPRFSPDGKTIAFTGQYDGNTEVYTMPSTGGEPQRITYTATNSRDDIGDRMGPNNIVMAWTPDGEKIVYRNRIGDGFLGQLCTVDKTGGLSQQIPLPEGGFCSYSPDGKKLAYNRVFREFRNWKYYRGGMADDIWIYDTEKKQVENITNNPAQDIIPMWMGDEIYFLSDRDRTMNIFVYNTITKKTSKVTDFSEYDVKFANGNDGLIVFENGGYIYKLDPATKKYSKVDISLSSDNIYARSEIKDGQKYLSDASLSPDGQRLAVSARGEIFDLPADKGVTKNITRTPGAHERDASWSPDGKYIAYISDASGETEIYLQNAKEGKPEQMTKNNDTYIWSIIWSPDSKKIAYNDRKNRLYLLDIASKSKTLVVQDSLSTPEDPTFSPDSKWLAYTKMSKNKFDIVYAYNIEGKKESAVTDLWYDSGNPAFSKDGKYLFFTSVREFNPIYGSNEWNFVYPSENGIYFAVLSKSTPSPFLDKDAVVNVTESGQDRSEGKKGGTKKKEESKTKGGDSSSPVQVNIDFDGISDRILQVPLKDRSYYYNLYSDGEKVYYSKGGNVCMFDLKTRKEEPILESASYGLDYSCKKALFFKDKKLYVTDIPTAKINLPDPVNLSDMKITTDYPLEWKQIFNEAWRIYRDGFYLANMHDLDWTAIKHKYEVLVPYVKNRLDLNYIIGAMISELCTGHAYVNPGEADRPAIIKTGLLGAKIVNDKSGFFKIDRILKGASWSKELRSPLTEPGLNVKEGDYIVAIDGIPTDSVKDIYSLLRGKADVLTELAIDSKPQLEGARKIVVRPIDDEYPLYHYNWVQDNLKKVEKASGGRIGYIYIPDMGVEGLNEFSRYFYPQIDKEGLIIDDRYNGGGNVSPMILERLAREPYRLTMQRDSKLVGTVPDATQVGPKVCLINKYSASDGDLFPWGFRALKLGKLIGTRTWGGIIGISGSLPFIDGTDLRVPGFTSYDPKSGKWIIENHGVDPDIEVENDPVKEFGGDDEQLQRAIEEVMKELKDRKPLPPVPAPRTWNDYKNEGGK